MKKIVYTLTILGLLFSGCNPMDDIYKDIDEYNEANHVNDPVGEAEYTLTADDYETLELGFGSFDSEDQAKELLPGFIAEMYPNWGEGSSVTINYNLYIGAAEGVSDYTNAEVYTLTNDDYASTGSDAFGFYPNVDPTSQIPGVLDTQIASPEDGQMVLASYKQYFEDPEVGLTPIAAYNFAGSMEGWTTMDELDGGDVWTSQSGYVQGNGYFGGQVPNIEWLVSPEIDLANETNLKLQINQQYDYAGDLSLIKVLVKTDWDGSTLDYTTWDEITFANLPTSGGGMTLSEDYDFSAYEGETVHIAFRYESTDSDATRWRVASLEVKALGVAGDTDSKGEYFVYSGGSWEPAEGVYYLSSSDYDSMGTASGQPGQYNNFSSSAPADNYIVPFLTLTAPYAYGQDDDEIIVIYRYYSSSCSCTQTRGNLYSVADSAWMAYQSTIEMSLQFGFEDGVWVPDNTIRYTLTNADYEYIASALDGDPEFDGLLDTLVNYHDYDYNWTQEQIDYSLGVLADNIDPSAAEGQKYLFSYLVYDNGLNDRTSHLIKTDGVWVVVE